MIEITRVKYEHPVFFKVKKPDYILNIVSEYYGIRVKDVLSKGRTKHILRARRIARYLIREKFPQYSFEGIGEIFKVHHSSIMKSIDTFKLEIEKDADFKSEFEEIKQKLIL